MTDTVHLIIEAGASQGRTIAVTAEGLRIGRASKNDLVLDDPLLSRHHCRIFLKPGQGLWVADLGSANQTMVNDKVVQESQLRTGDRVTLGTTVLRVVDDATAAAPAKPADGARPVIDLGLAASPQARPPRKSNVTLLLILVLVVAALALAAWAPKLFRAGAGVKPGEKVRGATAAAPVTLEVDYEKVQASTNGIFRYRLLMAADRTITIQVDDTGKTHVRPEGHKVDPVLLKDLASFIRNAGFFDLDEEYVGIQPNILDQWDISVTINRTTHRTRVANRVEPAVFKAVREKLEDFGHVELNTYAIQYTPEKLTEMAREAFLLGRKFSDERDVAYGNLANAIKSYTEAEFCLNTVDPKPDFYADALAGIQQCREELDKRYDNQNFLAERAVRLKSWDDAVRELRVICDMIPDRADPRNQEAQKKLLEVEDRIRPRH